MSENHISTIKLNGESFPLKSSVGEGEYTGLFGLDTEAKGKYQFVSGKYNIPDTIDENGESEYAHIIGNGTEEKRSNAYTLDWNGNAIFAGLVYSKNGKLVTKEEAELIGAGFEFLEKTDTNTNYSSISTKWPKVIIKDVNENDEIKNIYFPLAHGYTYNEDNIQVFYYSFFSGDGKQIIFTDIKDKPDEKTQTNFGGDLEVKGKLITNIITTNEITFSDTSNNTITIKPNGNNLAIGDNDFIITNEILNKKNYINNEKIIEINNSIDDINGNIGSINDNIDVIDSNIDIIKNDIGSINNDIDIINNGIGSINNDIDIINDNINSINDNKISSSDDDSSKIVKIFYGTDKPNNEDGAPNGTIYIYIPSST